MLLAVPRFVCVNFACDVLFIAFTLVKGDENKETGMAETLYNWWDGNNSINSMQLKNISRIL